jgi:hypothetical protein
VRLRAGDRTGGSARFDSRDEFEAFGECLMPILSDVGIELAGEPEVLEIYNIVRR